MTAGNYRMCSILYWVNLAFAFGNGGFALNSLVRHQWAVVAINGSVSIFGIFVVWLLRTGPMKQQGTEK